MIQFKEIDIKNLTQRSRDGEMERKLMIKENHNIKIAISKLFFHSIECNFKQILFSDYLLCFSASLLLCVKEKECICL